MADLQCYLCSALVPGAEDEGKGISEYRCECCGTYRVTWGLKAIPYRDMKTIKPFLRCATRQASEALAPLILDVENYQHLVDVQRAITVSEKINRLLNLIARRCVHPGGTCEIDSESEYPLIAAQDSRELYAYVDDLQKRGIIAASDGRRFSCELTVSGWRAAEPTHQQGGRPGTCFVAMWFDPSMNEPFELGIAPAIRDCSFEPIRIDRKEHNNQITDEIMAGIRGAQFTVADFTGQRAGVYYEAGFARGLGRDVIYCCRADEIGRVHFDTSVISHVVWTDPVDLRRKLAQRIQATILPKA